MDELSAPTFSSKTAFAQSLFNRDVPPDWTIGVMDDVLRETEYGLSEPGHSSGDVPIVGMRDLVDGAVLQVDGDGNLWLVALTCEPAQLREYVMGSAGGDPVLLAVYELRGFREPEGARTLSDSDLSIV